ncbi:GTP-binding protein Era [Bowdeniella nasicola]|uniref:GTPase Era n=1 Tax=Bowdeniella nasicola TaxID=208480 RepID=A0A1H3W3U6_9ACTO|nr:GTPase Era [Bowdeniella nasicola]SDZ81763.1 GTP-binding protein Era [Bowdeniella nasicola]
MNFPSDDELMAGEDVTPAHLIAEYPEDFRAGFACMVGRPNVGKSTLTNAMVGQKIAITSLRPQTTRHTIRGIVHRDDAQLVLVDTPGFHRPRTLLGKRLNDVVRETLTQVDVIVVCLPATDEIGPGDRFIVSEAAATKTPLVAAITKTDLAGKERTARALIEASQLADFADLVPVSAVAGHQVDTLTDVLVSYLPKSPPLYPSGDITDEPENVLIAEFVREAALEGVREELPHSLAVLVEETRRLPAKNGGDLLHVYVTMYVERESQKAIVIGRGGSRLREVGSRARSQIEALLGEKIYLDVHVKVAKDWQRDPKLLGRLGF